MEWVSLRERSREASMASMSTSLAKERMRGSRRGDAILRPDIFQYC